MPKADPILPTITSPADLRALSIEQLETLAQEIRESIITQVAASGGHLAPNLGVVELTIAMHYVFDFSHDRLLFDVGHQCYPHKLLTGRLGLFDRLRTRGGMAGFPDPSESPYDLFAVGHAGTAISTAVGMARADTLDGQAYHPKSNRDGRRVAALVGDASIVNGVAMEGLNAAGTLDRQFLVVLNDNGMSISKPQGAVSQYFGRLRLSHIYSGFKRSARRVLQHVPGGSLLEDAYHRFGEATKAMIAEHSWFEHFGLVTVGPIDGHHLPTLIEFLAEARDFGRPMVLHVKTIKGKGLEPAEHDATRFHSPGSFTVERDEQLGCRIEVNTGGRTFTAAFADALCEIMDSDERVVAATAAMPDGTGVARAIERFPDRAWDTGICESHAMDMMAGLARAGHKPFLAVYATFFQRAFDQAFQEVALQGLPVRLCLDRAGLVGGDGAVHHGFCDIALFRTLPDAAIMAAIDEPSLGAALEFMRSYDTGISSVRYPRAVVDSRLEAPPCPAFTLGTARALTPECSCDQNHAPDAVILAFGAVAMDALDARDLLADDYRLAVYDARFAKPVDRALIAELIEAGIPILTVEEHSIIGGFGVAVIDAAQDMGLDTRGIGRLGIPDAWIAQDPRASQLAEAGLDAAGIARAVRVLIDRTRTQGWEHQAIPVEPKPTPSEAIEP